jgi:hypothetical protein
MNRGSTSTIHKPAGATLCSPSCDQIAARAYQIYLGRGCQQGHDLDDWLQAEYELRQLPLRKLVELAMPTDQLPASSRRGSLLDVVRTALL